MPSTPSSCQTPNKRKHKSSRPQSLLDSSWKRQMTHAPAFESILYSRSILVLRALSWQVVLVGVGQRRKYTAQLVGELRAAVRGAWKEARFWVSTRLRRAS